MKLMTRLRTLAAALGVLGITLGLATPRDVDARPQFQAAALAIQEGNAKKPTPTPTRTPAPSGKSQTQIADPAHPETWFQDPIGRIAYVFRMSRHGLGNESGRNVAIAFVDITGLKNLDTTGYQVVNVADLKSSNPALYRRLDLANRPEIRTFAIVPESNNASNAGVKGLHSEQKLILEDTAYLSPYDGGASITPDRIFAFYSDRSPCAKTCAPTVVPSTADVFYATVNDDTNAARKDKLAARDMAQYLSTAQTLAREDKAAFNPEVAAQVKLNRQRGQAEQGRRDAMAAVKDGDQKAVARRKLFADSAAASKPCNDQALGNPAADPCFTAEASTAAPSAAADNGLIQALAEPNVVSPGGIDFSKLQLSYLADPGDGSGLQYAFQAPSSATRGGTPAGALDTAALSSDAFFVWLELDPSTFWVNLNPTEPGRIVDAQMGRTDVGRIMLQADLQLKKDVGTLIHPSTPLGNQFWSEIDGDCLSSRVWVVPAPAQVYSTGDKLYILSAPLNVKMETDYIQLPPGQSSAVSCPQQDNAAQAHNKALFRGLILPKLVHLVNTDPRYADLRTVYLARVAAEWYRNLSASQHTTYADLIDQSDIAPWTTKTTWTPTDTFRQYAASYTKGDYRVTRTVTKGNYIYTYTYTYGGVDLTSVPLDEVSDTTFAADNPGLARNVSQSLTSPTVSGSGVIWFGSLTPLQAAQAGQALQASPVHPSVISSLINSAILRRLPLILLLIAAIAWRHRRRTRKSSAK